MAIYILVLETRAINDRLLQNCCTNLKKEIKELQHIMEGVKP
ncbi:hypothetical protein [Helicobacter cetorum]|nr:hypothetical protein [Helicobacter cetorum]